MHYSGLSLWGRDSVLKVLPQFFPEREFSRRGRLFFGIIPAFPYGDGILCWGLGRDVAADSVPGKDGDPLGSTRLRTGSRRGIFLS